MKIEIDWDTADAIAVQALKAHYKMNKKALKNFKKGVGWLHSDDVTYYTQLNEHMKVILDYYGEKV